MSSLRRGCAVGLFVVAAFFFGCFVLPAEAAGDGHTYDCAEFIYDAPADLATDPSVDTAGVVAPVGQLEAAISRASVMPEPAYDQPADLVAPNPARFCSFAAATEVSMADGTTKPISKVEVGDFVLAEDPKTGDRGAREVTHLWVHQDTIVDLEVDGHDVATTEDHPFWNDTDGEWQRADVLDSGDLLLSADGDLLSVDGMDWGSARTTTAYNLTVDDIHTYFVQVADDEVLVHNSGGCDDAIHGMFRGATRTVDVDDVVRQGDIYVQSNGMRVYVSPNGNGISSAAILDGPLTTSPLETVLESVSDSSLANRIADGRWMPVGDLSCLPR